MSVFLDVMTMTRLVDLQQVASHASGFVCSLSSASHSFCGPKRALIERGVGDVGVYI
jgi:hypothetical protein